MCYLSAPTACATTSRAEPSCYRVAIKGCCLLVIATAVMLWGTAVAQAQPGGHGESSEDNTALGVNCGHCHVEDDWKASTKPTFEFAGRMVAMVCGLNAGPLAGRSAHLLELPSGTTDTCRAPGRGLGEAGVNLRAGLCGYVRGARADDERVRRVTGC